MCFVWPLRHLKEYLPGNDDSFSFLCCFSMLMDIKMVSSPTLRSLLEGILMCCQVKGHRFLDKMGVPLKRSQRVILCFSNMSSYAYIGK